MEFNEPIFRIRGRMATAAEFLKAYQGSFPVVFPATMEYLDYLEFAEDYADYVCTYEKHHESYLVQLKQWVAAFKKLGHELACNCLGCLMGRSTLDILDELKG